jgi:aminobenzoyl-glutamate utilization protein B
MRVEATTTKRAVEAFLAAIVLASEAAAQPRETALDWISRNESHLLRVADDLHARAEPAHHEVRTSSYLQAELRRAGFGVESGVAGLPTAFVASFGSGRPVVGIVALLDALSGLSEEQAAWHGCGHNLIGAADLGAVLAVKEVLASHSLAGTVRFYGAPAEEIYHGGVYMVREGLFRDLDALLFWHPSSVTTVIGRSGLAMDSLRFVFRGRASDATDAPEKGRNALSAAYALSSRTGSGWPKGAVVNHVLLEGGNLPSVVPERATIWYFLHAPDRAQVDSIRATVTSLAEESARATGTEVEEQSLSSTGPWLVNRALAELLQRNLGDALPLSFGNEPVPISDDTAEASWVTPRGGFLVQAFASGTPSHSREWSDTGTSELAHRGLLQAARALASTASELLTDPGLLKAVREEFESATAGRSYVSPLPPGRGPFDYLPRPH